MTGYQFDKMSGSASCQGKILNGKQTKEQGCCSSSSNDACRHRKVTCMTLIRGMLCLVVMLTTAFMMLAFCAPVTTLLLRLCSVRYSRKATSTFFAMWLALWPFLFEKINKTKVVFYGESVPPKERVLLFANHRTEVDWMYLWDLALRKGCIGYIKYILKSSLMKLPLFGWAFQILEFIPVERKWEIDEPVMLKRIATFKDAQDPLWLAVFPEGTDYTGQKCIKSQQYAAENGLPIFKNVLLPKTKGFNACLQGLRSSLDAVYDVTIGYRPRCPVFLDNVFGADPFEVHVLVQRIPVHEIPNSEEAAAKWLMERFRLKDQVLSDFIAEGRFPRGRTEGDLSTAACLANCCVVITMTSILLYLSLFSSAWFRIYLTFSCVYLSTVTYLGILPPQLLRSTKAKKTFK